MPVDIEQLVQQSLPSMLEGLKDEIKTALIRKIEWDTTNQISKTVSEWVTENVIPEIVKELNESKEGLISVGVNLAPVMVEALTTSMLESFKKKLETSYERKKIYEACFGGY